MAGPADEKRQCPTRADGADPLIAHLIDTPTCARRQQALYHKCPSCVHLQGGEVPSVAVLPPAPRPEQPSAGPRPVPLPVHRAS